MSKSREEVPSVNVNDILEHDLFDHENNDNAVNYNVNENAVRRSEALFDIQKSGLELICEDIDRGMGSRGIVKAQDRLE